MDTIFINGRYLTQPITGVQRYATEIIRVLDSLLESGRVRYAGQVILITPRLDREVPVLNRIKVVQCGMLKGHFWEQLELPYFARKGILLNLCGPSPIVHGRQISVLHDASVFLAPQAYSLAYGVWTRFLYRWAGFKARRVLTVSTYSKTKLLEECTSLSAAKLHVVYPGCDHVLHWMRDDSVLTELFGKEKRPYVLCVGSQQPNKNVRLLARLASRLQKAGFETVITGGGPNSVFRGSGLVPDNVLQTGRVSDARLRSLYENAACFVFPSLEEGFGIPPLEAMSFGCPVVASSSASIPEVCGDAAEYFDPFRIEALNSALLNVLRNEQYAEKLKLQGLLRASRFTWEQTAMTLWQHVLSEV